MNDFDLYNIHIEQVTQNRINELLVKENISKNLSERFRDFIYINNYSVFDLNYNWLRVLKYLSNNNINVNDNELHRLVFKSYVDPLNYQLTHRDWTCHQSQ